MTLHDVDQGVVRYREGVAHHPMIVFQAKFGRGWDKDTQPVGHKPTGVNAWGLGDKQTWGAVMECVSGLRGCVEKEEEGASKHAR